MRKEPKNPETSEAAPAPALAKLEVELQQAKDQYLRAMAETDNQRKRHQREKDDYGKYANERFVRSLLPLMDSLDRALASADRHEDGKAVLMGVRLIRQQLTDLLAHEGVERIAALGQAFDPHRHEAVAMAAGEDGVAPNTVLEEVHPGYTMHGKVLRPAMVKVAAGAEDTQGNPQAE